MANEALDGGWCSRVAVGFTCRSAAAVELQVVACGTLKTGSFCSRRTLLASQVASGAVLYRSVVEEARSTSCDASVVVDEDWLRDRTCGARVARDIKASCAVCMT